jgi:hypothetical protein
LAGAQQVCWPPHHEGGGGLGKKFRATIPGGGPTLFYYITTTKVDPNVNGQASTQQLTSEHFVLHEIPGIDLSNRFSDHFDLEEGFT